MQSMSVGGYKINAKPLLKSVEVMIINSINVEKERKIVKDLEMLTVLL